MEVEEGAVGVSGTSPSSGPALSNLSSSTSTLVLSEEFYKRVLQGIFAGGFIDENGLRALIQGVHKLMKSRMPEKENVDDAYIKDVIEKINKMLEPSGSIIESAFNGVTEQRFYYFSLFNLKPPIISGQPRLNGIQEKIWNRITHDMMRKYENFSISIEDCIIITYELGGGVDPEKFTTDFIELMLKFKFLEECLPEKETPYGPDVTLGTRALLEFRDILIKEYGDVLKYCEECNQLMLNGFNCPVKKCTSSIHQACLQRYLAKSKRGKCPSKGCKCNWKEAQMEKCKNYNPNREQEASNGVNEEKAYFNMFRRFTRKTKTPKCQESSGPSSRFPRKQSQPCKCFTIVSSQIGIGNQIGESRSVTSTNASREHDEYLRVSFVKPGSPVRRPRDDNSQEILSDGKNNKQAA